MGPIPTVEIEVEGTPAMAIGDTYCHSFSGALDKSTGQEQEHKDMVRKCLAPTTLCLKGYGGESILIFKQGEVKFTRQPYTVTHKYRVTHQQRYCLELINQSHLGFRLVVLVDSPQPPMSSPNTLTGQKTLHELDPNLQLSMAYHISQHLLVSASCRQQRYLLTIPR